MALKREEAKLVRSIKLEAGKGNNAGARELAKSLVRMRQQQTRLQSSKAQLSGVSNNIRTAQASSTVAASMKTAGTAMQAMGQTLNPQKMQQDMQAFARENQRMDMAGEMMDDAIDGAFSDDEEEGDEIMNQVLDEIGIDVSAQLGAARAPRTRAPASAAAAGATESAEDAELRRLLAGLK
eukprot:CAMPEP_0206139258 /NCGR_PEP_ID=MMETSP1473-20131121/5224_1 /ASSEMBLY_ACC=CAM_ASM_001109 /TAXON_ID=1461547 /ORGANISM="Stichococcus sp, Strain RCC1054" /LENGTH=180 /DNA_ID=CAMNT_0053532959 /DNA_START=472 /DNA_END=1014 /DNA_ORIENTATION=-